MNTRLSARLKHFDSSDFRRAIEQQQKMVNPIDLSVGLPEDHTADHIKAAGVRAIMDNKTRYTPTNGIKELREALSQKLSNSNNIHVSSDDVTVVPGLTTGLLLVYMAILDPGDEIIVLDPCYPPYTHLAAAIGAEVMTVLTLPTFQPDIETIKASITNRTKAIVINSPNNPTGAVYSKKDLLEIAAIAEEHNLFVISDEIYEKFVYTGEHFSIGSVYPNTITMNGFSKEYAMTGWRIGYIAGPSDVISAINELQQYIVFSSSSIAQYAALAALGQPSVPIDKYHKKRDLLVKSLKSMGFEINGAQGSFYTFIQAPNDLTDLDFIQRAAAENVILVPGRAFSSRHGYIRISYGVEEKVLIEGIKRLQNIVSMIK
jgi:aspartate aminotransferase/aminotransferase